MASIHVYNVVIEYTNGRGEWPINITLMRHREQLKQFHGTTLRAVLNAAAKRIIEEEKSEREP